MTHLVFCLALATYTFFATCSLGAAVECTVDGSNPWCKCHGTDDAGKDFTLDLSKFLHLPLENIPDEENPGTYVYTFSPCPSVDCSSTGDTSGVACQVYTDPSQLGNVFLARTTIQPAWSIVSLDPLEFTVTYCDGDLTGGVDNLERCADVKLQYDTSQGSGIDAAMESEFKTETQLYYNFVLKGKSISLGAGGGGGGVAPGVVGWILMSIFFAAILTYFIVGIIVNYKFRDARGCEAVPNSAFWRDLPFLIKDGFLFTISPCYKRGEYQRM